MNQHSARYNELMDMANASMTLADEMTDAAYYQRSCLRISEVQYREMMDQVKVLQDQFITLRDEALEADFEYWKMQHADDSYALSLEQEDLRHGG